MSERVPASACYHCGKPLDGATDAESSGAQPHDGAVSICLYCGAVAVFGEDLLLARPGRLVIEELFNNREFVNLWAASMRARAMLIASGDFPR